MRDHDSGAGSFSRLEIVRSRILRVPGLLPGVTAGTESSRSWVLRWVSVVISFGWEVVCLGESVSARPTFQFGIFRRNKFGHYIFQVKSGSQGRAEGHGV